MTQTLTLILAIVVFVTERWAAYRQRNREIYQSLELAANEFFRFEAQNPDLLVMLKSAKLVRAATPEDRIRLISHLAQNLTLFEMAYRFRRQRLMPADVFLGWIKWIFEFTSLPGFHLLWPELRDHYLPRFAESIDSCIESATDPKLVSEAAKMQAVYGHFFSRLGCPQIRNFLDHPNRSKESARF